MAPFQLQRATICCWRCSHFFGTKTDIFTSIETT
eukprot:10707.XXX_680321_680422_1 [CDS] Oithona nana genome sequencing.